MEAKTKYIDFIGFTFNGFHSLSDLNILRVSDGSRYEEIGSANFQDISAQAPGRDGSYYWNSNYNTRDFTIAFAYDNLNEVQFQKIKSVFNTKDLCPLVFDEYPYKQYMVKLASPLELKYVCFNEGENHRTYKGEGNLHFISYSHCGKSVYKFLKEYRDNNIINVDEWKDSTRMFEIPKIDDTYTLDSAGANIIYLYNPGDFETDIIINIDENIENITSLTLDNKEVLRFENIKENPDTKKILTTDQTIGLEINTKTHLVEEVIIGADRKTRIKTGVLYNRFLINDTFFKIPQSLTKEDIFTLEINGGVTFSKIKYDYLYF